MTIELNGYNFSVYAWIARLALHEKGVAYTWFEVNPFAPDLPQRYIDKHPFGRVPALIHDRVCIYETGAITRYIDEAFDGPALQPTAPKDRARVNQVISVVDSYVYWPLVRQVFSHGVFRPRDGRPHDPAEVERGLAEAPKILSALERLAGGGPFLVGDRLTLADIHLAPMLSYFAEHPRGAELLLTLPRLADWRVAVGKREAFLQTRAQLPGPALP